MRRIIILAIAGLVALTNLVNAQEYKISGHIEGLDGVNAVMRVIDSSAESGFRWENIPFVKGNFEYSAKVTEPEVIRLFIDSDDLRKSVGRGMIPTECTLLQYIAYPGATIKVAGEAVDYCNAYPSGDKENEIFAAINAKLYPLMNEAVNISVKLAVDSTLSDEFIKLESKKAEELYQKVEALKMEFLTKHASSIAGLYMMEHMIVRSKIAIEKVSGLMDHVDADKYKDLSYYKTLETRVKGYKETGMGMIAPKITGTNVVDGKEFDLASLKGKFVIIDFWGTWCGACLAGVHEMKKFRDAHADKLQIVGLAKDNSVEKVQKCMTKNGMNWPNILVGKGEQDYVAKYNVQGFPTKILLDRNGKILLRSVGEKADFYQEVEKLIQ
ncbi:hypothetical protein BZG02_07900 [Labilibaculum filiforme]|uniref:Thioredoxin domain-containing protein n=1 Tax=Labilibaculum filiforme TaxID=1940526 RepID=A0A2N3I0S1_9BACT|nr:TlpA disulfide reductase family protein [Labilibaculum filiforme]PKQ63925.1 hypothetical protein BZG02_07900 [Labilibaculum filiforme]